MYLIEKFNHKLSGTLGQLHTFSILFFFNYPIYYAAWYYINPHHYENLALRFSASLFCLLLGLHAYWPNRCKVYLPLFWFLTVTYCLPFFFLFMTLKNNFAMSWLLNLGIVCLHMFVLFDAITAFLSMLLGGLTAYIVVICNSVDPIAFQPDVINLSSTLVTFIAAVVIGGLFANKRENLVEKKVGIMKLTAGSIAHELRTPLLAIRSAASGLQRDLPVLVEGYRVAYESHLVSQLLSRKRLGLLQRALETIQLEADHSHQLIAMLLTNLRYMRISLEHPTCFSITTCIEAALSRYIFLGQQRQKIDWDPSDNVSFQVKGEPMFIMHVLFNLLKNALYFIEKVGRGRISIRTCCGEGMNTLIFKDTGPGISAGQQRHIFDAFFSDNTHQGAGVGLAFCKMVMQAHGGEIRCESQRGHYTVFLLSFPVIK